jgi:molybdopterin synthase catalytic subunit
MVLVRTPRATSLTPSTSMSNTDSSTTKNARSIDDLIESLNQSSETPKKNSKKKYGIIKIFRGLVTQANSYVPINRSSTSTKKSTATKELEDLMESLTNFKLPAEVN